MPPIPIPLPNPVGGLVEGFIEDLAGIFLNPGQGASRQSLDLLLSAPTADLASVEVISIYLVMFGLGMLIAFLHGSIGLAFSSWGSDPRKVLNYSILWIKEYAFGAFIFPLIFGLLYFVVLEIANQFTVAWPVTESMKDDAVVYDLGNNAVNLISGIALLPFTVLYGMEVVFAKWFLPIVIFVGGPLMYSLSGGNPRSRLMSLYWGLVLFATTAAGVMQMVALTGVHMLTWFKNVQFLANTTFAGAETLLAVFGNWALLVATMLTPIGVLIIAMMNASSVATMASLDVIRQESKADEIRTAVSKGSGSSGGEVDKGGIGVLALGASALGGAAIGKAHEARATVGPAGNREATLAEASAGIAKHLVSSSGKKAGATVAGTAAPMIAIGAWVMSSVAEKKALEDQRPKGSG